MTIEMKGKEVFIKNFFGEKVPRKITMPDGVEVKIDKDHIKVSSIDIELAGQAAALFEMFTKVSGGKDRRVFQDGIYLISKPGREM